MMGRFIDLAHLHDLETGAIGFTEKSDVGLLSKNLTTYKKNNK